MTRKLQDLTESQPTEFDVLKLFNDAKAAQKRKSTSNPETASAATKHQPTLKHRAAPKQKAGPERKAAKLGVQNPSTSRAVKKSDAQKKSKPTIQPRKETSR